LFAAHFQPGLLSQSTTKATLFGLSGLIRERAIPVVEREIAQAERRTQEEGLLAKQRERERDEEVLAQEARRHQAQLEAMREQVRALHEQVAKSQEEREALARNKTRLGEQLRTLEEERQRLVSSNATAAEEHSRQVRELEGQRARALEEARVKEAQQGQLEARVAQLSEQMNEVTEKLECKICFEPKELVSLVPCGHVLCQDCATDRLERGTCATCGGQVTSIMRLFL